MLPSMPWCIIRTNHEVTIDPGISLEGNLVIYYLQKKKQILTVFFWKLMGQLISVLQSKTLFCYSFML